MTPLLGRDRPGANLSWLVQQQNQLRELQGNRFKDNEDFCLNINFHSAVIPWDSWKNKIFIKFKLIPPTSQGQQLTGIYLLRHTVLCLFLTIRGSCYSPFLLTLRDMVQEEPSPRKLDGYRKSRMGLNISKCWGYTWVWSILCRTDPELFSCLDVRQRIVTQEAKSGHLGD